MNIKVSCHCRTADFSFSWPESIILIGRRCSCTYCTAYGAVWISDPAAILTISADYKNLFTLYQFGHKTADFCFCKVCGVLCFAICNLDQETFSVVNISSLEVSDSKKKQSIRTDFSTEVIEERLVRRKAKWSPVRFF